MNILNSAIHSATAFAPATCANIAVGFDILGLALNNVGDYVTLTKRKDNNIIIENIEGNNTLPMSKNKNTASVVVEKLCQDLQLDIGFSIQIKKGIPLSSGMGGSAASAVAALVACNTFLNSPLSNHELAKYALAGEELASGQPHADNIVPCIFGGLTLIHSLDPIKVIQLPIPKVYCAVIRPHLSVQTKLARKILKKKSDLKDYVKQSAHLAAFISALYLDDIDMLKYSMNDVLIEHQRAHFIPRFYDVKEAALRAGALGVSISGSGPTMFALTQQESEAKFVINAMQSVFRNEDIDSDCWVSSINKHAAQVVEIKKRCEI